MHPSGFAKVLEMIGQSASDDTAARRRASKRLLPQGSWLDVTKAPRTPSTSDAADSIRHRLERSYRDDAARDDVASDDAACDAATCAAGVQLTTSPANIAEELGLTNQLTAAQLSEIRRTFALRNHPDLVHPSHRRQAARRMALANMLIDEACGRLAKKICT